MHLKKIFRTYKTLLIAAGLTLVSLLGVFLVVVPMGKKVFATFAVIKTLSSEVSLLRGKANILGSIDEGSLRTSLLALTSAVPPDKSIPTVMSTFDGVAARTGVQVVDITIQKPGSLATESAKKLNVQEVKIGANVLPVSLTVLGELPATRSFLSLIGAVRRFFRVQSINISFSDKGPTTRLELAAFFLPYPTAIGGVSTPITALSDKENDTIAKISALPLETSLSFAIGTPSASGRVGKVDPFSP